MRFMGRAIDLNRLGVRYGEPPYLFANNSDRNFSQMWRAPVFKEKNALPRSELHFSIDHRYGLTRARQCHPDM
jgi:hypothetical protein